MISGSEPGARMRMRMRITFPVPLPITQALRGLP